MARRRPPTATESPSESECGAEAHERPSAGASNQEHALGELFAGRYAPLVRLAMLLGAPREVAEEKVMDAFSGLAPRFDSVAAPAGYLRTAVVNGVHSHHRRLRTVRSQPEPRPVLVEDPEIDELWQRLGELGRNERACVVLRYYEDLSVPQIATELDMPLGTVKSHLHRAIAALRDLLSEEPTCSTEEDT